MDPGLIKSDTRWTRCSQKSDVIHPKYFYISVILFFFTCISSGFDNIKNRETIKTKTTCTLEVAILRASKNNNFTTFSTWLANMCVAMY